MLGNIELSDGRTVRTTLEDAICRTMPTAAVASGWVSAVDVGPQVAKAVAAHGWRAVEGWTAAAGAPEQCQLGLTWVRRYCEAHGLPASDMFVKPFRQALLMAALRDESAAGVA